MIMKGGFVALAALAAATLAAPAHSAVLTEDFEAPFADWETRWFGTESNAQNYYVVNSGSTPDYRGNNPDGLWLADGNNGAILITFNADFAASLTELSFDIATFTNTTLTIFDTNGVNLFSGVVTPTSGAFTDPGTYVRYGAISANGIGGFSLSGSAEGNTSIDNLVAVTGNVVPGVPEPATWAMMIGGFGAIGAAARSRRSRMSRAIA